MENENQQQPQKKSVTDVVNEYKKKNDNSSENNTTNQEELKQEPTAVTNKVPTAENFNPDHYQNIMQKETDPDLTTSYEIVKLPSKGVFYENKISELDVEYMTSKDEDLITTPSLIESGKVLDVLLKRKIKTKGIDPNILLPGDRNAVLLFLRTSSYGFDYEVEVSDPRTGIPFKSTVDLGKLEYKEVGEMPDEYGHFSLELPMRKKEVKLRLISAGEDNSIFRKAEEVKEAYGNEFSEYNTMKLKASIVSIEGNTDRSYIDRFVNAMPAGDSLKIRRKLLNVQPDVDMSYEFTAKDGFKFKANLSLGVDFFFPAT